MKPQQHQPNPQTMAFTLRILMISLLVIYCLLISSVHSSPLLISDDEAALIERFSKLTRRHSTGHQNDDDQEGQLLLLPTIRPRRYKRQDSSAGGGFGDMLTGVGSRFNTMRDSWRDTVKPIQEQLNPMPHFETFGKMLAEASTNTMNRGRETFRGVRDFGSRSMGRLREGVTDTWDSLRDGWEDFWDL